MNKYLKKPYFIWIIIGIIIIYGLYSIFNLISTFSFYYALPVIIIIPALIGLVLNKEWSKYLVLCLALLVSLSWAYAVITFSSTYFATESIGTIIISLIPGGLLLMLCLCVTIAVFRYFKTIKKET